MVTWLGEQFKGMDFKSFSFGMVLATLMLVVVFGAQHIAIEQRLTALEHSIQAVHEEISNFANFTISKDAFLALKEQVNRIEGKIDDGQR